MNLHAIRPSMRVTKLRGGQAKFPLLKLPAKHLRPYFSFTNMDSYKGKSQCLQSFGHTNRQIP